MQPQSIPETIEAFLAEGPFAVFGASTHRWKYGNKVLRAYMQDGRKVYPINPGATEVEGLKAYPDLASLPETPRSISFITPPEVTEQGVAQAIEAGARFLWMQPGAQSERAIELGEKAGLGVIADGSCLLVVLGYRE